MLSGNFPHMFLTSQDYHWPTISLIALSLRQSPAIDMTVVGHSSQQLASGRPRRATRPVRSKPNASYIVSFVAGEMRGLCGVLTLVEAVT
jgi:hypothetical protein